MRGARARRAASTRLEGEEVQEEEEIREGERSDALVCEELEKSDGGGGGEAGQSRKRSSGQDAVLEPARGRVCCGV